MAIDIIATDESTGTATVDPERVSATWGIKASTVSTVLRRITRKTRYVTRNGSVLTIVLAEDTATTKREIVNALNIELAVIVKHVR